MLCIKQNVNIYKAAIISDTRRDLMRETYFLFITDQMDKKKQVRKGRPH